MMKFPVKKWKDILHIVSGKNQKEVLDEKGEYPIYGSGGPIGKAKDYLCEAGTTVIGRKGTIDNPIYVNQRFWNIDTAFGIAPGQELNTRFLFFFCLSFNFKSLDKSTTLPSLAKRDLEKISMPVPPLVEQERIVAKIEALFSQLETAVAELKKAKDKLNVYRQAVLKEAFAPYINELTPLHHLADYRLGKMLDKEKNSGDLKPYIRNENVRWFSFDLSDIKQMRFKNEELETFSIKRNDLVMCEGGEPGRCAVWNEDQTICFQKALHRIRLKGERNPLFYMYLFNYYSVSGFLKPFLTGSGIKHLPQEKLVLVPVPDPTKNEQHNTVSYIEERLSLFSNLQKEIEKSIQRVTLLRQSILKLAFEGKI